MRDPELRQRDDRGVKTLPPAQLDEIVCFPILAPVANRRMATDGQRPPIWRRQRSNRPPDPLQSGTPRPQPGSDPSQSAAPPPPIDLRLDWNHPPFGPHPEKFGLDPWRFVPHPQRFGLGPWRFGLGPWKFGLGPRRFGLHP